MSKVSKNSHKDRMAWLQSAVNDNLMLSSFTVSTLLTNEVVSFPLHTCNTTISWS